jgi:hypothetical protein
MRSPPDRKPPSGEAPLETSGEAPLERCPPRSVTTAWIFGIRRHVLPTSKLPCILRVGNPEKWLQGKLEPTHARMKPPEGCLTKNG